MFELLYGWRLWRRHRLQWVLIVSGFACFSAMLLLLLQLHHLLAAPTPSFVGMQPGFWAKSRLVTVQRQDEQGNYKSSANAELNKLALLPEVQANARVKFSGSDLRLAETNIDYATVVYFSPELAELLQLPVPFSTEKPQGVYLSHWAWQASGRPELAGLTVLVRSTGRTYNVNGILPASMDRFSQKRPALWLPWQDRFKPVDAAPAGGPGARAIAVAENLPGSIAFAKVAANADLTQLAARFAELPTEWLGDSSIYMLEQRHQPVFLPGVELYPEQRADLLGQWWLLSCLTWLLGAVVALNLIICLFGQFIRRHYELNMRQLFGAQLSHLIKQSVYEQLPLWLTALGLGTLLYALMIDSLSQVNVFKQYFGQQGIPFDWSNWAFGALIFTGFVLCCALVPLLLFAKKIQFFRNRQGQQSKMQQWLLRGQLVLQMTIAAYALLLASSLQYLLWQQQQAMQQFPQQEIQLRLKPGIRADIKLQQGQLAGFSAEQLAWSLASFSGQSEVLIRSQLANTPQEFYAFSMPVSANYLQLLQQPVVAGSDVPQANQVVINQAAADLLRQPGQSYDDLVGASIEYQAPLPMLVKVGGIVANLPHHGVATAAKPALYNLLPLNPALPAPLLQLLVQPQAQAAALDAIEEWAWQQGQELEVKALGSLAEQLRLANEANWIFAWSALILAFLISALASMSLYFQVTAQLNLQQSRLATMLAVGAPSAQLLMQMCWRHLGLLSLALPLVLSLSYLLNNWLAKQLGFYVLVPWTIPPVLAILVAVVLVATWWPASRLFRQPIVQLLRSR